MAPRHVDRIALGQRVNRLEPFAPFRIFQRFARLFGRVDGVEPLPRRGAPCGLFRVERIERLGLVGHDALLFLGRSLVLAVAVFDFADPLDRDDLFRLRRVEHDDALRPAPDDANALRPGSG